MTARDVAVMAATLANRGVNPVTGEQVVSPYAITHTLSVMTSSGMYDFAGEWVYRVGMPAKSGVGGGILSALPGQLGLGSYSPLLDSHGNSVRGIKVCEKLSAHFDLHMLNRNEDARNSIIADYDIGKVHHGEAAGPTSRVSSMIIIGMSASSNWSARSILPVSISSRASSARNLVRNSSSSICAASPR